MTVAWRSWASPGVGLRWLLDWLFLPCLLMSCATSCAAGAALRNKALPVSHQILAATGLTSSEIVGLQNLLDRVTANLDGFNPLDNAAGE